MSGAVKRIARRVIKIAGISIGSILLLMFLLPYLFPGFVTTKIKQWAGNSIRGELNFSGASLSFFRHFPSLTLSLHDVTLKGAAPFATDTLLAGSEIALGVDLGSLFSEKINIDKVFVNEAYINVLVDEKGNANYAVYNTGNKSNSSASNDSSSAALKIEKILIEKSRLVYNDRSIPMRLNIRDFYYEGTGDLSKAIFDLQTKTQIGSLDFIYDNTPYLVSKKLDAELVTKINTNSLELIFEKNNITINQLPVQFNGRFEFLSNGYNIDFKLNSSTNNLASVFTALPAEMVSWMERSEIKGKADISAILRGKYIAGDNIMPDISMNMKIRDGYISHSKAPSPVQHLFLNLDAELPQLDMDKLNINIDSAYFTIDDDYFSSHIRWKGMTAPEIYAKVNSAIDLEKWSTAIGLPGITLKGKYQLRLLAEGQYAKGARQVSPRVTDTIITSIPRFTLHSSLENGFFKYAALPEGLSNISFTADASCADNNYRHVKLGIENINAAALNTYIKGFLRFGQTGENSVDAQLQSIAELSEVKKFLPLDSMEVAGSVKVDIQSKGRYLPAKRLFPGTTAQLNVVNGSLQTKYYPHPVSQIQVGATVTNTSGNFKTLRVKLTPVSFLFEGQPFVLKANLFNFDNLQYDITSRGTINLGKLYQVFAQPGYGLDGFIQTNLSLHGKQSDAAAGQYDKLFNSGTLKVKDVRFNTALFPHPFYIRNGLFRFKQDKMWFESFTAGYGTNTIMLNGYLQDVISYSMQQNLPLKGHFDLQSDRMIIDDFMVFADSAAAIQHTGTTTTAEAGVIIVPSNLSIGFTAAVKSVRYNDLDIKDVKGELVIDSSQVKLNGLNFTLIDAPVTMDAVYRHLSAKRASFDYHITAEEFDVKKAYREIRLFRELASAASKAEGIVSLDYRLNGKLDGNMYPMYPSLKGGGTLSLKKVKVKGLKLFGAVSKAADKDINDPDLSKVDIKTSIKNNIITVERTRMRIAGFRPRIEGQVSFDGQLNIKFRLGLPPFGIIGIPMTVTGNQNNPKVQLRRGNKGDALEETEDVDESEKDY